jgi:hypothetical protein
LDEFAAGRVPTEAPTDGAVCSECGSPLERVGQRFSQCPKHPQAPWRAAPPGAGRDTQGQELAHVLTEAIRRGLFVSAANLENRALGAISAWDRASALGAARPAEPDAIAEDDDAVYGRGDPTEEER